MRASYLCSLALLTFCSFKPALGQGDQALFPMQKKYKWGFINKKGKWVIQPKYPHVLHFSNSLAAARELGVNQWGYINKRGEWAIEPQFGKKRTVHRLYAGKKWYSASVDPFKKSRAAVKMDGALAIINKKGKTIKKFPGYEGIRLPKQERAAFNKDDKWGFLDKNWQVVIKPQYHEVSDFHQGLAYVQEEFGDSYGFINKAGDMAIEAQYDEVGHFANGLAPAKTGAFDPWGYINKQGEWAIEPQYDKATAFSDGLAFVKTEGNGRYINKNGETIINCNFDGKKVCEAHPFRNGLAIVSLARADSSCGRSLNIIPIEKSANSAYAYINKAGEIVYQQPFEDATYLKNIEDSLELAEKREEKREAKAKAQREREELADCKAFKAYGDESASSYLEIGYMGIKRRFYYNNDVFQKKEDEQFRYHIPDFQQASGKTFLSIQPLRMEPDFMDNSQLEVDDLGYMYSLRGNDCIKFPSDATDDAEKIDVQKKSGTMLWKQGKIKYTHPDDTQNYVLIKVQPDQYKKPADQNAATPTDGFLMKDEEKIDVTEVKFKYSSNEHKLNISARASKPLEDGGTTYLHSGAEIENFKQEAGKYYNEAVHRFDNHYIEYFEVLAYSDEKVHIKCYQKPLSEENNQPNKKVNKDELAFDKQYLEAEYIGSGIANAVEPKPVPFNFDK